MQKQSSANQVHPMAALSNEHTSVVIPSSQANSALLHIWQVAEQLALATRSPHPPEVQESPAQVTRVRYSLD